MHIPHHIKHLLIDSRKLSFPSESLFFAIVGDYHNGHDYIPSLYQQGVRAFVVSEKIDVNQYPEATILQVEDTVLALQQIAAEHLQDNFYGTIIGITGSNGKTIVKEWLYQLLQADRNIVRSPKSYNSQVGVPLSVWQANIDHEIAIFEAGISQVGEMERLANIIRPEDGIFINIGSAHDKGFANRKEKVLEKMRLFRRAEDLYYCKDYELIEECILELQDAHEDTEDYQFMEHGWTRQAELAEEDPLAFFIRNVQKQGSTTTIIGTYLDKIHQITIPFADDASIENAIHCWWYLIHKRIPQAVIQERFLNLESIAMRLELKTGANNCVLINDAYNSDVHALQIALDFLLEQKQQPQKTLILSDIFQSGQAQEQLYQEVAALLEKKQIHRFIGVGERMCKFQAVFQNIPNYQFFKNTPELLQAIHHDLSFKNEAILIKGARSFGFEQIIQFLEEKVHGTVLEIYLHAIAHNLKVYRQLLAPATKLMVMVKALSYGSGGPEIAHLLRFHKVDYLGVAYVDEGVSLRKAGVETPIMVLNPELPSFPMMVRHQLEPEIYSLRHLQQLIHFLEQEHLLEPYPIHLKIDTGMHRLGFEQADSPDLLKLLNEHRQLVKVISVFSHLAASEDAIEDGFSQQQIQRFEERSSQLIKGLGYTPMRHILNTAGIVRFPQQQYDMVRLGLGLYGIDSTHQLQDQLEVVSCLKTYISQIKTLEVGETVGYGRKGKITRPSKIATVNIGYGDGYRRDFSQGVGKMLIKGQLAPIIGNVCMDMCMLDITDIPNVEEGEEVIVFGQDLLPQQLAQWTGTIPYEIITGISGRVRRVYFEQ